MHLIDNPWAIATQPAPQPVGAPGWFQSGDETIDLLATVVDYDWCNTVQAEIVNVVQNAGLALNKTDDTQLLQSIIAIIQREVGADLSGYVRKAGDAMTGPLSVTNNVTVIGPNYPGISLQNPAGPANQKLAGIYLDPSDNFVLQFTSDDGTAGNAFLLASRSGYAATQLSLRAQNIGLYGPVNIGGVASGTAALNVTDPTAIIALGTSMSASLTSAGGNTALIFDGRSGYHNQLAYDSDTQMFGFSTPAWPGASGPVAWQMDWSGNTVQQGNARTTGQFISTILDPYAGIAISSSDALKGVAGPWIGGSDARIKHSIVPYPTGLAAVLQLNPVEYSFIPDTGLDSTRRHIGIIGQEVQPIMPEMITTSSTAFGTLIISDLLIYNPNALQYALVNAVKELAARVAALEAPA